MDRNQYFDKLIQLREMLISLTGIKNNLTQLQNEFTIIERDYIKFANKKDDIVSQTVIAKLIAKIFGIILLGFSIANGILSLSFGSIILEIILWLIFVWVLYTPKKNIFFKIMRIILLIALIAIFVETMNILVIELTNPITLIIYLMSCTLAFFITYALEKIYKKQIIKKTIERYYEIKEQMVNKYEEYQYLETIANNEIDSISLFTRGWFPPGYCELFAVEKFIEYFQNFKADNIKEAVILFDQEQYQLERINLMKQQNNILMISGIMNYLGQMNIADAIDANTEAINNNFSRYFDRY